MNPSLQAVLLNSGRIACAPLSAEIARDADDSTRNAYNVSSRTSAARAASTVDGASLVSTLVGKAPADEPERIQGKTSSVKINVFSEQLSARLLQECAEIWVACFTGPPRFESWTKESAEEELKKYLEQNGDFILAMPSDEQVAAFAVGLPVARHYGGTDLIAAGAHPQSYYFVALGTRPEYRRQGLGAALHKRREEEGVKRGYSVMTVRVRSDNADNLRLLERAGFSETGRYQASIGQSIAERLIMTKFVSGGVTDS